MPVPGLSLLGLKRIRGFVSILRYINPTIIIIISPDKSWGYTGFMSVVLPSLYFLTCVHDNSKTLSRILFKLGTHMYLGKE